MRRICVVLLGFFAAGRFGACDKTPFHQVINAAGPPPTPAMMPQSSLSLENSIPKEYYPLSPVPVQPPQVVPDAALQPPVVPMVPSSLVSLLLSAVLRLIHPQQLPVTLNAISQGSPAFVPFLAQPGFHPTPTAPVQQQEPQIAAPYHVKYDPAQNHPYQIPVGNHPNAIPQTRTVPQMA